MHLIALLQLWRHEFFGGIQYSEKKSTAWCSTFPTPSLHPLATVPFGSRENMVIWDVHFLMASQPTPPLTYLPPEIRV